VLIHIVQARSQNTRLPGKNFLKIGEWSMIEHHLRHTRYLADVGVVATPYDDPKNEEYARIAKNYGYKHENPACEEDDVLKRFVMVCDKYQPDWVVRTTADCWDMDAKWCDKTIRAALSNGMPIFNTFRENSVIEVFPAWCLYRADIELPCPSEHREHVTSYFRKGFVKGSIDTKEELERARNELG